MTLVRVFTLRTLQFNIAVHARHVPGLENWIAETLSRQQIELFRELDPSAKEFPVVLPLEVWQTGVKMEQEQ